MSGLIDYLNHNANAFAVLFAILSGVLAAGAFVWQVASRYQKIETRLDTMDTKFDTFKEDIKESIESSQRSLEEKIEYIVARLDETSNEARQLDERLVSTARNVAIMESILERQERLNKK